MIVLLTALVAAGVATELLIWVVGWKLWWNYPRLLESALFGFSALTTDLERQRHVLLAAQCILKLSMTVLLLCCTIGILVFVPTLVGLVGDDAYLYFCALACFSFGYAVIRLRARFREIRELKSSAETDYPTLVRWLHWIALEFRLVRRISLDLECFFFLRKARSLVRDIEQCDCPVYVCGLARSGTTILLQLLERTGTFCSPTYRDMPFVLAPNLWNAATRSHRQRGDNKQRAHGDGMTINFDSPESFEEVFWSTFTARRAVPGLAYSRVGADTLKRFDDYRALVVHAASAESRHEPRGAGRLRYLSKNNNNLLRLDGLISNAQSRILIVYRDPAATAWSLHRQHRHFCTLQTQSPFVLHYMQWLGHHEFGLGHRPFEFARRTMDSSLTPDTPDYWLAYWVGVYRYLLDKTGPQVRFVCHDDFCRNEAEQTSELLTWLGVNRIANNEIERLYNVNITQIDALKFHPSLLSEAREVSQKLNILAKYPNLP